MKVIIKNDTCLEIFKYLPLDIIKKYCIGETWFLDFDPNVDYTKYSNNTVYDMSTEHLHDFMLECEKDLYSTYYTYSVDLNHLSDGIVYVYIEVKPNHTGDELKLRNIIEQGYRLRKLIVDGPRQNQMMR